MHDLSWWFMTIFEDFRPFVIIHDNLGRFRLNKDNLWQLMMIHVNSWQHRMIYDSSRDFMRVHDNLLQFIQNVTIHDKSWNLGMMYNKWLCLPYVIWVDLGWTGLILQTLKIWVRLESLEHTEMFIFKYPIFKML